MIMYIEKDTLPIFFYSTQSLNIYSWQKGLWKVTQNAFNENTHQKKKKNKKNKSNLGKPLE